MIAEARLIHNKLFSVNLGLKAPAKTTFNKSEIKGLLEHEIIGRYYFQKGQNIYAFKSDEVVTKSVEILSNDALYKSTLHIK